MLNSILTGNTTTTLTLTQFFICTLGALGMGLTISLVHMFRNHYSKNYIITLLLLPAIVQAVIMLVNGNLGTGVAVMGAFSLVRFRSVPGNSREIGSIFLAMGAGLAAGMGYIVIGFLLIFIIGAATAIFVALPFGRQTEKEKALKVTIPENLDYTGVFDDLFQEFTTRTELLKVRTVNMGSLYELYYYVYLKDVKKEKLFLDAIRCRNGNLDISCGKIASEREEL